jgi:hypothetical protein
MKITSISKLFCAIALCFSLTAFADKKDNKKEKSVKSFNAAVFQIGNSNKVKLAVDTQDDKNLRIMLKDKAGRIYYSELYNRKDDKYRRVFNFDEMTDGTYYFELSYNNQKLVKELNLETSTERNISLQ